MWDIGGQSGVFFPPNYGFSRRYISKNYPYFVTVPASVYPIALDDLKAYLRLDPDDTIEDAYLTLLIQTVTNFCENYCNRNLINKTYRTFRDGFDNAVFQLGQAPFLSLVSFQYLVNGVWTDVDSSIYYIYEREDYSSIYLAPNCLWPNNCDLQQQSVRIIFTAGYGETASTVPSDLIVAMLQHTAALYQNRGDDNNANVKEGLSRAAEAIYNMYRIIRLSTEPY